ncbi:IclR family transcriptional regulator [Polaromonas sp. P1(28)-13]|nr:IclR family transcriptional regulator [Polaromonas sp. P1(28)-13]
MKTPEVKSAARILDLLELLSAVPEPLRLTDVAKQMGMPMSSTSGLMNTLAGRGYVEASGDGYVIAPRYRQGNWVLGEYGLMRRAAQPLMTGLAAHTGESCFLAIPAHDWQIQYIEKAVSENPLRYDIALPMLRPAHSTSVGRVMLADHPLAAVRRYLASDRITRLTEMTVTDPQLLLQEVERVRDAGFALISDSSVLGASGVAAPIRGVAGAAIGALCVIAPTPRFDAARDSITRYVCAAAAQISAQLPSTTPPATSIASASQRQTRWSA